MAAPQFRIKTTAAEQRQLWREVGEALAYGKNKLNRPAGQKFSDWAVEQFPGICIKNDVPDAIWFATEFPETQENLPPA